jgi:8-amino-7-oxononanoate synthase
MLRQQGSGPALGDPRDSTVVAHPRALRSSHPMVDATIDEIDGRLIRIGSHWLIDFTSGNYLGFDVDPEIVDAVPRYLARWGTQPGWSRLRGSPVLYEEIETRLATLLGVEDALVLPTLTHIHNSVLPSLAGRGTIFVDSGTRRTLRDACTIAGVDGATLRAFPHNDTDALEALLRAPHAQPRAICVDGVNNLSGNPSDLSAFARLAREFDALLYVDDSHGFGVLGERSADELCDYGLRGNGTVRHFGARYDNVVVVGSLSKGYSSQLAYIGCSTAFKQVLKNTQPYLLSGQSPIAALATVIEGLRVNEDRGDRLRLAVRRMTERVLSSLRELGIATPNVSGLPIVEIPLANPEEIDAVGAYLFHHGIYVTMAVPPFVPEGRASFRLQITAVNTWEQIEQLVRTLGELSDRFRLRSAVAA